MTPNQYCQDLVARQGSILYYSTWPLEATYREAIITLYALSHSLNKIPYRCTENYVARSKIQWWRNEIERTFINKPSHPIGFALQNVLHNFHLPQEIFQQCLEAIEYYLHHKPFIDEAALNSYLQETSGLELAALSITHDAPDKYFEYLNLSLQKIEKLRHLRREVKAKRIVLIQTDLNDISFDATKPVTPALANLLKREANKARHYYQQARHHLIAIEPLHCHIMANLNLHLLIKIEKNSLNVLSQDISLIPIYKLWIAWRTMQKHKKALTKRAF